LKLPAASIKVSRIGLRLSALLVRSVGALGAAEVRLHEPSKYAANWARPEWRSAELFSASGEMARFPRDRGMLF
jgi:hypothetical protein